MKLGQPYFLTNELEKVKKWKENDSKISKENNSVN